MLGRTPTLAVIGGGAGGCFGAIIAASNNPGVAVTLYEKSHELLGKVRVSGGGRCNVTHHCFEPAELVKHYPRGDKELIGPFYRFGPAEMIEWFRNKNVSLKTEKDGRIFPVSDSSETIIQCFKDQLNKYKVNILKNTPVTAIQPTDDGRWAVTSRGGSAVYDKVLVATGGSPAVWAMLQGIGLDIIPPVPSLFTFNIRDPRIRGLQGISVPYADIRIKGTPYRENGPLLITHWGMSGPAILKLSARAARELAAMQYRFMLEINFVGEIKDALQKLKLSSGGKLTCNHTQFSLPTRLWQSLCQAASISPTARWADLSNKQLHSLQEQLCAGQYAVHGKSTFKEEFVTAGGVSLKEIDFKTMQARRFPGLYFTGEVLDIDGLTGGFNFQAVWTTAWIAGKHLTD